MLFRQGFGYWGGFDKPLVVSRARIRDELAEMGFFVVGDWPCEELYGDACDGRSWDHLGYVVRAAPSAYIDVPSRVKWIVEVAPPRDEPRCEGAIARCPIAQPTTPPPVPPPTSPPPSRAWRWIAGATAAGLVGAYLFSRR